MDNCIATDQKVHWTREDRTFPVVKIHNKRYSKHTTSREIGIRIYPVSPYQLGLQLRHAGGYAHVVLPTALAKALGEFLIKQAGMSLSEE